MINELEQHNGQNGAKGHGSNSGLPKPTITSYVLAGRRRLHYNYTHEVDMIEDYDIKSGELISRRWKKKSKIGEKEEWEIGEPIQVAKEGAEVGIKESSLNDTLRAFEWRVRNLPYTADNFELSIDSATQQIVIRTKNKKYFKRLDIPDTKRYEPTYALEGSRLDWSFKNSTLVVSYSKPDFILVREATMREEFIKLNKKNPREGEIECTYQ